MSVYYYNGAQILAPYTIRSNEPMYDVDTVSLKKQRATQNVQRWELEFNTVGTPDTVQDMLISAIQGTNNISTMVIPQLPAVDELLTITNTSPVIVFPVNAGATSIVLQVAGNSGTLPKGYFFKFNNHDKVYMTTTDINFDGSTDLAVSFYPSLRLAQVSSNVILTGSGATINYYKSIDNQSGITFTDGVLSNSGNIELIEAL
jgi:hypothetical protein